MKKEISYCVRTLWMMTGIGHTRSYYEIIYNRLVFDYPSFLVDSTKRELSLIKQFPYTPIAQ